MADVVQALELEISAKSGEAVKSLRTLASSLRSVRSAIEGTQKTVGATTALDNLTKSIRKITNSKSTEAFTKLADSLQKVGNAAASLRKLKNAVEGTANSMSVNDAISKMSKSLGEFAAPDRVAEINELATALERLVTQVKEFKQIKGVASALNAARQGVSGAGEYVRHHRNYVGRHERSAAGDEARAAAARVVDAAEPVSNIHRMQTRTRMYQQPIRFGGAHVISREEAARFRGDVSTAHDGQRALESGGTLSVWVRDVQGAAQQIAGNFENTARNVAGYIGAFDPQRFTMGEAGPLHTAGRTVPLLGSGAEEFNSAMSESEQACARMKAAFDQMFAEGLGGMTGEMDRAGQEAQQLKAAADALWGSGEINARMWRQVREEIDHINFSEPGVGGNFTGSEAMSWVRDLAQNLAADNTDLASSGGGGAANSLDGFMKDIDYAVSHSGDIEELTYRIENMKAALAEKMKSGEIKDGSDAFFKQVAAIKKLVDARDKLNAKIEETKNKELEAAQAAARASAEPLVGDTSARMSKAESRDLADQYIGGKMNMAVMREQLEAARASASGLRGELTAGLRSGQLTAVEASKLAEEIKKADERVKELQRSTSTLGRMWQSLKSGVSSAVSGAVSSMKKFRDAIWSADGSILGLLKNMTRMARYRIFRFLIREISEGFRTGLTNVREYSKAINGLYAQDMQGLDNTLLKMKNSLGAALAPAVRALIPLFQTLANWVITVSNYVNQFFAMLTGQSTWTRAVEVEADSLDEQANAAGRAARANKNLLASWDELNIIQSAGGNGSGGSSTQDAENYLNMFEEVAEFDSKIRDVVAWVKDNLGVVEALLAGIGAKLLGLKFPAAITISGIVWSFESGKDAGAAGKGLVDALKDSVGGILLSALGGAGIGFSLMPPGQKLKGAAVGFLVGGAIGIFASILGWQQGDNETIFDGELFGANLRKTITTVLSFGALGAAMGFAFAGWRGGLVGFSLGATVGMYLSAINYGENQGNVDFDQKTFMGRLGAHIADVFALTATGLIIGAKYGGWAGAAIGATVGLAVSMVLNGIQLAAESRERIAGFQKEFYEMFATQHYGVDVTAIIESVNARVRDVNSARAEVQKALLTISGAYTIMLGVGLENVSDTEKEKMLTDLQGVVRDVQSMLDSSRSLIQLSVGVAGAKAFGGQDVVNGLMNGISIRADLISQIGTRIGELLATGTEEEFAQVVPAILSILSTITTLQAQSEARATYGTGIARAGRELGENPTEEELIAYYNAHEQLISDLRESADANYHAILQDAELNYATLIDMRDNPQKYIDAGLDPSVATAEAIREAEETLANLRGNYEGFVDAFVEAVIGDDSTFQQTFFNALNHVVGQANGANGRGIGFGEGEINPAYAAQWFAWVMGISQDDWGNLLGLGARERGFDAEGKPLLYNYRWTDVEGEAKYRQYYDSVLGYLIGPANAAEQAKDHAAAEEARARAEAAAAEAEAIAEEAQAIVEDMGAGASGDDLVRDILTPQQYELFMGWYNALLAGNPYDTRVHGDVTGGLLYGIPMAGGSAERAAWQGILQNEVVRQVMQTLLETYYSPGGASGGGGAPTGYVPGGTYVGTNYGTVYGAGYTPGLDADKEEEKEDERQKTALIRQLVTLTQKIADKEWEIKPSSNFGRVAKESEKLYASAKG